MKKLVSIVVVFALLCAIPTAVSAENNTATPVVRLAILDYFVQRENFLLGRNPTFSDSVPAIRADEADHLSMLAIAGAVWNDSNVTITELSCYGHYALAEVREEVTYTKDGIAQTEIVEHQLTVHLTTGNIWVVGADAYRENVSGFESCSYVPTDAYLVSPASTGTGTGSDNCLVVVATREVGVEETGVDMTKYGEWLHANGKPWCVGFVSWCANQANIPTTVIPRTNSPYYMITPFTSANQFYYSAVRGGTEDPQVGDLFFLGTEAVHKPSHMGIVAVVYDDYFYVIDGNWGDKVCFRVINKNASNLLGFARPAYESEGHTYTCSPYGDTQHLCTCVNCDTTTYQNHTLLVEYDGEYHWHACLDCTYESVRTPHNFVQDKIEWGFICYDCGYHTTAI